MTNEQYRELTARIDKAHRVLRMLNTRIVIAIHDHNYQRMARLGMRAQRVSEHMDALIGQQMAAEDEA